MITAKTNPASQNHSVFFVGTSGWTYEHWKGRFYPQDLPKKAWFDYYAREFQAVEVNATFYRSFTDQTYQNWKQRAPQGFIYVLKAARLITHRKYLLDVDEDIRTFYQSCLLLQDKFGMILLQVAPNTPYDLTRLQGALSAFSDPKSVAVEFRHSEWLNPNTMSLLRSLGATICNVDSPQQRITDNLTSDRAYLRLHGRHRWYVYNYSEAELMEIAELAQNLLQKGAKRVYIFLNNDFKGYAPFNAMRLRDLLKEP